MLRVKLNIFFCLLNKIGNRISKIATSTAIHNGQDQSENVPPQAKKVCWKKKSIKLMKNLSLTFFLFKK